MVLSSYSINIYSGQTASKRATLTESDFTSGQLSELKVSKSVQDMYQEGRLDVSEIIDEPDINDRVSVKIDGTKIFEGSVRSVEKDYRGSGSRVIDLIGKTYDLYREAVTEVPVEYNDDWSTNLMRDLVSAQTSIDYSDIPSDSGTYISGNLDLQYYSVGEAAEVISEYDNYNYYVDENDKLQYFKTSGQQKTITDDDLVKVGRKRRRKIKLSKRDDEVWNYIVVTGTKNVSATASDSSSIDAYGKHLKIIRDVKIDNDTDAQALANSYLDEYKNPTYEGSLKIDGDESLVLEQDIKLNLSNLSISGDYNVKKITHILDADKGHITKLDFGRAPYNPSYDEVKIDKKTKTNDKKIAEVEGDTTGKSAVYYQDDPPADPNDNDLWFDTNNENKPYVYQGSGLGWSDATNFEAIWSKITGTGKPEDNSTSNPISVQSSEPSGAVAGDLWVDSDTNLPYLYDGSDWVNSSPSGQTPEAGTQSGQMLFWDDDWNHTETSELFWDDTSKGLSVGSGNTDSSFQVVGDTKLGDGDTNYVDITESGQVSLHGKARVKKCIRANIGSVKAPPTKAATFVSHGMSGAWEFSDGTDDTIVGEIIMPNDIDTTVAPELRIQWSSSATDSDAVWQIEYLYRKGDEDTTVSGQETLSITETSSSTANGLVTSTFTGIDSPDSDDVFMNFRLKRLGADASDTLGTTAEFFGMELEYTSDKIGKET